MMAETKQEIARIVKPGLLRARRQKIPAMIINTRSNACTNGVIDSRKGIKLAEEADDVVDGSGRLRGGVGASISFIAGRPGRAPAAPGAPGIPGIGGAPAPGASYGAGACGPIPGGNLGAGGNVGGVFGGGDDVWLPCASRTSPVRSTANTVVETVAL